MSNIAALQVEHLGKIAHGRAILSDVSFSIERNSLVSLIGPNGAGKSTLIKILLGFDKEYTGSVDVHNQECVSYIPQIQPSDARPIPISVYEYMRIGSSRMYSGQVISKNDLVDSLEHVGLNGSILSQTFWSLSGGERQRVAIARALLGEPTLLVLDEPLSAVDYGSRDDLYKLIRHLQQDHDMTVLLVSHDIDSVLPISDRVLCLNKTLHADCHPCDVDTNTREMARIHHHC